MLFDAGAVNRFGKVDDGSTVTDYDEEAIARKHTLAASLAYSNGTSRRINRDRHARHGQLPDGRSRALRVVGSGRRRR
jgi:hypothetical protein